MDFETTRTFCIFSYRRFKINKNDISLIFDQSEVLNITTARVVLSLTSKFFAVVHL